jgi:hypothetical protein
MTAKGRTGGGHRMPGLKQNKAFVIVTWPAVPWSRTVKDNMTIRLPMEWYAAFYQLPGT